MVGLNTSLSGLPPNWKNFLMAGQATAIVDAQGRGMFRRVQDGVDYVEALVAAGKKGGQVYVRAGLYKEVVTITQTQICLMGESWDTIIDGTTAGNAIDCSAPSCVITNLSLRTTAGGGNNFRCMFFSGGAASSDSIADRIQVINCDNTGVLLQGQKTGVFNSTILAYDDVGIAASNPKTRIIGNYIKGSADGINPDASGDNALIVANQCESQVTLNAGADNSLIVANVFDLAVTDNSTGSTVTANEIY